MMLGNILSRVLGIVYLIPWLIMIGSPEKQNAAQAIFNAAYTPYALFLSLGTAGFPTAIARQVAGYNGQNKFKNSLRVLKVALGFMLFTGLTCGIVLYVTAPAIAKSSAVVSSEVATTAIRVMVPTLVILPPMSLIRGFYLGNNDTKPFAVSQLWEQLVRVLFILSMTYFIIYMQNGSYIKAVNYSTFATFVGAIASYLYLIYYAFRKLPEYKQRYQESLPVDNHQLGHVFIGIIKDALPFIYIGSAVTIYQFIDQITFKSIIVGLTGMDKLQAQNLYTYFSANPNKITTVVVSLTIAIAATSLPLLAEQSKVGNKGHIRKLIVQNMELMLVTLLPCALLLAVLAWEVNGVFFPFNVQGANLMALALVCSIALALFSDLFMVSQSLGHHRLAVKMLTVGIVLKLTLQVPLTYFFSAYGTILATAISFGLITLVVFAYLRRNYLGRGQLGYGLMIILLNIFVGGLAFLTRAGIDLVYIPETKITAFIYAAIFGLSFLALYILMLEKFGLLDRIFGFSLPVIGKKKRSKATQNPIDNSQD